MVNDLQVIGDTTYDSNLKVSGNITVNGDVTLSNLKVNGDVTLGGSDCAEKFDINARESGEIEPGTVMTMNEDGLLTPCIQEYDKKVAGIVSGAGQVKPGIILGNTRSSNIKTVPIALMGKAYCKVDATHSAIEIGDLLTTSPTKVYAMKAEDPFKAFGAVIGKALGSIKEGIGLIPVLVALQ